ncbi:MAG: hypothetical protein WCE75_08855, partial [Terracidiphilus sp.]
MHRPLFLHSASPNPPLRVGLLLDGPVQPAWVAEVLEDLTRCDFVRVALVVYNGERAGRPRRGPDTALDRRSLLFNLYARWDRAGLNPEEDPFRPTDLSRLLKDLDSIEVVPERRRFVHRFAEPDIERIRERNLDVLLRFGFNILHGEILTAARYGIWSYHHGDSEFYRGGPAYFWETVAGEPVTGAMLQVLTGELDAGRVLERGYFATRPGRSWSRNRVQPYWGSATFIQQKLKELHEHGWERVERGIAPPAPYRGKVKIYTAPRNRTMVEWLVRRIGARVRQWAAGPLRIRRLTHWKLGLLVGDRKRRAEGEPPDPRRFHWTLPPRGHFHTDP